MIDLLGNVWDAVRSIPFLVADLLIDAFNLIIAALGGMAAFAIGLLPNFPDAPEAPDSGVLGFVTWVLPLGGLISTFGLLAIAWATWQGLAIALRWVKAL